MILRTASLRWLASCMLLLVFAACSGQTEEQRLRTRFAALQQTIAERDAGDLAAFLADDFIGNDGLDRDGTRRLAAGVFLRHRDIGIRTGPLQVRLQGAQQDSASVQFDAALSGGSGGLLPDQMQWYSVDTAWRLEGGQWKMISARWKPRL